MMTLNGMLLTTFVCLVLCCEVIVANNSPSEIYSGTLNLVSNSPITIAFDVTEVQFQYQCVLINGATATGGPISVSTNFQSVGPMQGWLADLQLILESSGPNYQTVGGSTSASFLSPGTECAMWGSGLNHYSATCSGVQALTTFATPLNAGFTKICIGTKL